MTPAEDLSGWGLTALSRGLAAPKGFVGASLINPAPTAIRLLGGIPAPEALPAEAVERGWAQLWQDPDAAVASLQYSPVPVLTTVFTTVFTRPPHRPPTPRCDATAASPGKDPAGGP